VYCESLKQGHFNKRRNTSAISFMTLNTIPLIYHGLLISFVSAASEKLLYKELLISVMSAETA